MVRRSLTQSSLARAVRALCRADPDLRAVVRRHGHPPLWAREPGFTALVEIVLGQQISLAAARAAYARLAAALGGEVTAERLAAAGEDDLRRAGQTRQKSAYLRALGQAVAAGSLDVAGLATLDDDAVRRALVAQRGFGPWSADIYLLMALGRPDVWPARDLALAIAMREVKRLRSVPDAARQLAVAEAWRPWRAVAARILWHHYLSTPRRRRAVSG